MPKSPTANFLTDSKTTFSDLGWLSNVVLAEPSQKRQHWSRRDFLKRLINVDFHGTPCSTECEKQKQATNHKILHPSLSLSLGWNQQLNHCLTITLFNTLHTHQTRCTLKNFRPQTLFLQQSTFGTPARSTVRAKMVVPHSHADKSFTRRRVCSWDYTFTARRFGIGSSSSLLGHSRSSGESTDHKHGGHTNHCGHTLQGRKKKRKRNCHDSGH